MGDKFRDQEYTGNLTGKVDYYATDRFKSEQSKTVLVHQAHQISRTVLEVIETM